MNILLTGGSGYIGSHTAVVLANAGHEVVLFDNFYNSKRQVVGRINEITGKNVACVEGDIRNTDIVSATLKDRQIEAVIHLAGLKSVGESTELPIEYYANNVKGTISLLEAMEQAGTKTLIFSSSATVYGSPHYLPIDEHHPTSPLNPYGRGKLQIEEILKDVASSDLDWKIVCLRYFNPVGAHSSGLIGESPNGVPNNLMPYIAQVVAGNLPNLCIYGDDYDTKDGTGVRDYIHVMDLAEGHLAALCYANLNPGWDVFNLGTGLGTSVLDMVSSYERSSSRKIDYQVIERRKGDISSCYANVEKANSLLNWRATRNLDEMCASSWAWQSNI